MKTVKKASALLLTLCLVVSVFTACSLLSPAGKLIGAWRDSTGTMGYEFKKDGIVAITYADVTIPIINIRYDGTVDGTYTVAKNESGAYVLTVNYTILSQTLSKSYYFDIDKSSLTLTDVDGGSQTVLMKYTPEVPDTTDSAAVSQ